MDHPVPVTGLSPAAVKFADPGAPPAVKMMAASGLAPLGPTDLLKVLYALAYDVDAAVSGKARETAAKLPDNICQSIEQIEDAAVIDGLSRLFLKREAAIGRALLNKKTADETVVFLASRVESERVLEIVFANEVRLLRCPQIIEALYLNPAARMSSVDRAVELAVRNGIELKGIPTFAEIKAAVLGEAEKKAAAFTAPPKGAAPAPVEEDLEFMSEGGGAEAGPAQGGKLDDFLSAVERGEKVSAEFFGGDRQEDDLEFMSEGEEADAGSFDGAKLDDFLGALERGEKVSATFFRGAPAEDDLEFLSVLTDETSRSLDGAKLDEILDAIESEKGTVEQHDEEAQKAKTIESSLARLSVSQKIRVATLGNANQRAVLVRDANKLVVLAVLKSPGVGDAEIIRFSQARSLPDEAVRLICSTREWTKSYQVKLNLVNNPKTPIQDALRFMTHLRPNDLRLIENSRDVSRAIVTSAKQLRSKRGG
jgi:hypothetical protein